MVIATGLTDYQTEVDRTLHNIAQFDAALAMRPDDIEQSTLRAYRRYQLASLRGRSQDFDAAERAVLDAIERFGPREDLCLLKANLDFRFHRLPDVRTGIGSTPKLAMRPQARSILADSDFQEGRYDQARRAYEELIAADPCWDDMARLAHFHSKMGDFVAADEWFERAADELTAKQMRSFAWVELQRGVLDLSQGDFEAARRHYHRAARAYSGYWLIDEHIAELLAAAEQFDESEALYLRLADRNPKPELLQTIGELYIFMGDSERAEPYLDQARDAYLDSAQRGEVHYLHHLSDFFSDVRPDGAEAVKWARKDFDLRQNFNTEAAMALALHVAGRNSEALEFMDRALAAGVQDAHIFAHAATIYRATGKEADAIRFESAAARINPHFERFHVHH
jgi:tetratricopeptide (TPR) repeat protein